MDWLIEPFALGFQQRALIGGMIAALMCSVVGVWLVLRGMSFFGDAFVHGVMPGIAAAVLFDFSPLIGAALAAAAMVLGIELVHRSTKLKEDTSIGLLFVGMMALGVVIISRSDSYTGSLTGILFGDALGVSWDDIRTQAGMAAVVALLALLLYRPLMALSFSAEKARSLGMHPRLTHGLLLVLIAAAVIGSFRAVGTLLVFGLLVGPPATAALISRNVPAMFVWSAAISVFSVWAGLMLSYRIGTAGSATMALIPIVLFFLTLGGRQAVRAERKRRRPQPDGGTMPEPVPMADPVVCDGGQGAGAVKRQPSSPGAAVPLARAQGLVLAHGNHVAVNASDLEVPAGVTAVIGPNGSGKSTLLKAIAGVLEPRAGQLEVLGGPVRQVRPELSFVMQSVVYPVGTPMTVRDVVGMGRYPALGWFQRFRRVDRLAVAGALEQMRLVELAGRHLDELSGGQRQRVYVAQGIAQGHEVLLLDEPLTGLDLVSAQTIDRIIHAETGHGHSVVLTTHDLNEARAADHVLLMDGRVVASGPPEQVLTRANLEKVYGKGVLHPRIGPIIDDPACEPGPDAGDGRVQRHEEHAGHTP